MKNYNWISNHIFFLIFIIIITGCKDNVNVNKGIIKINSKFKINDTLQKKDSTYIKSLDSLKIKNKEIKIIKKQSSKKNKIKNTKCKTKNLGVTNNHQGYRFEYAGSYYGGNKYKYNIKNDTLIIYALWTQSPNIYGGIYFKIKDSCVKYLGYIKYTGTNTIYNQSIKSFILSDKKTNSFELQEWKKDKRIVGVAKFPNLHRREFKIWLEFNEENKNIIDY